MTTNDNAITALKEQLADVYRAQSALCNLVELMPNGIIPPDISPLLLLINEKFARLIDQE